MAFDRHMSVNDSGIKFPTTMSWGFQDISSSESGRTLSGKMNKEVVASKRTLSCSWVLLTDLEASDLLSAIKIHTYVDVNYPDPFDGVNVTRRFYTGDPSATMKTIENNVFMWDITIDFIEQ